MIDSPVEQLPLSFSLGFAVKSVVDGENILSTVPGQDGTIGGPTKYQTGSDGVVKSDEDQDDDK